MTIDWVAKALIVLLLFNVNGSSANEIWISQIGDNVDLAVTQSGENNGIWMGVNGDDNSITITQDGKNHQAYGINGTPITGDRNTITVIQNGSQHEQFEGMLIGDDNNIDVYQGGTGESNFLKGKVVGNNNSVTSWQGKKIDGTTDSTEGGDHEAYITVTGDNNTYHSAQTDESTFCCSNRNHLADIVTGNSNTVVHDQRGNGAHMGFIEVTGDSNDVDVLQRGGQGDHFYDLVLDGNSNSVTSIQKGNGAHSTTLDLTNNGGEYTVNTTNNGEQQHRRNTEINAPAVRNERKKIKTSRRREFHPTAPESPSPTRALDFSSPLRL